MRRGVHLKDKRKLGIIVLLVASLFIITQRVLTTATIEPQYNDYRSRYYFIKFLDSISKIGINLIPLYIGSMHKYFHKTNFVKKIGSFFLIYFFGIIVCNTTIFFAKSSYMNIHDFWTIFFPISQNIFVYGTSCVLGVLFIPFFSKKLDSLDNRNIILIFQVTSILFVILPTFFGKDLWAFQNGSNFVWVFYLLFVGYFIQRLAIYSKIHHKLLHLILSLVLLLSLIFVMTNISPIVHGDFSTVSRFSAPYSFFSMYYTLSLFLFLESFIQKRSNLQLHMNTIATFLINLQIITNWSLNIYIVENYYKIPLYRSGLTWIILIVTYVTVYFLTTVILTLISITMQKIPLYRRLEALLNISDYEDLTNKLKKLYTWLSIRKKIFFVALFFYVFSFIQFFLLAPRQTWQEITRSVFRILSGNQRAIILTTIFVMLFF